MVENHGRNALFAARKNLRAEGGEVSRVGVAGASGGVWVANLFSKKDFNIQHIVLFLRNPRIIYARSSHHYPPRNYENPCPPIFTKENYPISNPQKPRFL
jgi:hypothetical protein